MTGRGVAVRHLEVLNGVLGAAGWGTSIRFGDEPPGLRVLHPESSRIGVTVQVMVRADGAGGVVPWFVCVGGPVLAPCARAGAAVAVLEGFFGPWLGAERSDLRVRT
ncbi:hypothetical protein [Actinomadura kijaniata]|uniref:hypothetical protein n=1 Tax=Actinomadura kijaniata TaxID=46161 RepID=UPI000830CB4E|nr:hypothetical protein [Actinomadura kijaniata]